MDISNISIEGIPAILWGKPSGSLFIVIHGFMSCKDDESIAYLANEAISKGHQVLSFDLPEHGDRKNSDVVCNPPNCVNDLWKIGNFAKTIAEKYSVFACSIGAYFGLLAYPEFPIDQCLFLSPIVNMQRTIEDMMSSFNITESRLRSEKIIETTAGQTLDWDYYTYVKQHPITTWNKSTSILYGSEDNLCGVDQIRDFSSRFHCKLDIFEHGEHYFHTREQMEYFQRWLAKNIH